MLAARRALKDILAGGIFVAFGLAFALGSLLYNIGSPARMGPGFFPLVLGMVLVGFGVAVAIKGLLAGEGGEDGEGEIGGIEWRALLLITAGVLFFGLTVRGLGAGPALFGAIFLGALGRSRTTPLEALAIAVALTVLSVVIFIVLLQLRLPLWGSWLPF